MSHRLLLVGLNYATAPLAIRERIAFDPQQRRAALRAFAEQFPRGELVLLSTCNRVELYVARSADHRPDPLTVIEFIAAFHGTPSEAFRAHLYQREGLEAVRHLFNVASSLDSMVLGESQILGQVRDAYLAAREAQVAGNLLHPLFQRAVAAGRRVMTQTALGDGRLSVASVAVDQARALFTDLGERTLLSIGAGKMSALVLSHFAALSPRRLLVCNRDPQNAQRLAAGVGGTPVAFEQLQEHLVQADIVVSGTGAPTPIVTRRQVQEILPARQGRPLFMIDIAVPRDVEPSAGELAGVHLYNIDDLQRVVSATRSQRGDAVNAAHQIVSAQVANFATWHRQRELGPLIETIYARSHQISERELARTLNKLPDLDPAQRSAVEELARRIVNKVFSEPVRRLRRPDLAHLSQGANLEAIKQLFGLSDLDLGPSADETIYRDNI